MPQLLDNIGQEGALTDQQAMLAHDQLPMLLGEHKLHPPSPMLPTLQPVGLSAVHSSQSLEDDNTVISDSLHVNEQLPNVDPSESDRISTSSTTMATSSSSSTMATSSSSSTMATSSNSSTMATSSSNSTMATSSSSSTMATAPIVSSRDVTSYTASNLDMGTSLYGNTQSGDVVMTTAQSNSLDQLNPFGKLRIISHCIVTC